MDSHGALLVALHAQPAPVVTATVPVPPCAGTLADVGSIANEQLPSWVTVKVWPAIVSVPVRGPPAAALNCTVPLPVPPAPEVSDRHGALLLAVQAQPAPPVTVTLPVPPFARRLVDVRSIETVQLPASFTVKV